MALHYGFLSTPVWSWPEKIAACRAAHQDLGLVQKAKTGVYEVYFPHLWREHNGKIWFLAIPVLGTTEDSLRRRVTPVNSLNPQT
jgi:hypothetical protein